MADFGIIDRDAEDQDIAREGIVATGKPTKGGGVLSQLKAKFAKLDEDRRRIFKVAARNGEMFWLELDTDIHEDELRDARKRSEVGTRAEKRAGTADVSMAMLAGEIVNLKNTRLWAEDPAAGGEPLEDSEGDELTVHSEEWCELLDNPRDPVGGLRHLFGDMKLVDFFNTYSEVAGIGEDGASVVDPT